VLDKEKEFLENEETILNSEKDVIKT